MSRSPNADDAVKRAQALGAKVLAPPFDVMDAGRMAVLQDPTGATFCVWQAGKHAGAALLREPGALGWTELATRDTKAAEKFYTSLFGWTAKTGSDGGMEYTEFSNQGTPQAGMMPMMPQMGNMRRRSGCRISRWPTATPPRREPKSSVAGSTSRRPTFPRSAASPSSAIHKARGSRSSRWRAHKQMFSKPLKIPSKAEALPGREERMDVPEKHFVNGHRLEAPFPEGLAARDVRDGMLLGRGAQVLAAAGRLLHGGRLRGRARRPTRRIAKCAPA